MNMATPIPRIIHQTWKTAEVPARFQAFQKSWREAHPEWQYRLWTDRDNLALIEHDFPWFLPVYLAYPYPIQRVDAARYFILLRHGGLYADLDFECLRPLDALVAGHTCVVGLEPSESAAAFDREKILGNALIAAVPNHPFLEAVTALLGPHLRQVSPAHEQVILETTGPFMFSRVYDLLPDREQVTLISSDLLYPLTMQEADLMRGIPLLHPVPGIDLDAARRRLATAYAVHHHFGTWWRGG